MKNIFTALIAVLFSTLLFPQTQPTMVIKKTDNTTIPILLSEIQNITFQSSSTSTSIIVYGKKVGGQWQIWKTDPLGQTHTKVTNISSSILAGVSLSPDRTRIAFSMGEANAYNIYVINIDGTNQTKITSQTSNFLYYYKPMWKTNNRLFVSIARNGDEGKRDVIEMDADGTNIFWLTQNTTRSVEASNLSPDGAKIALCEGTPYAGAWTEVYVADYPSLNNKVQIADPENPGGEGSPFWSSQNKIYFHGTKIYRVNPDGSGLSALINEESYLPILSPDGGKILYMGRSSGINSIKIMNVDGTSQSTFLSGGAEDYWHIDWK